MRAHARFCWPSCSWQAPPCFFRLAAEAKFSRSGHRCLTFPTSWETGPAITSRSRKTRSPCSDPVIFCYACTATTLRPSPTPIFSSPIFRPSAPGTPFIRLRTACRVPVGARLNPAASCFRSVVALLPRQSLPDCERCGPAVSPLLVLGAQPCHRQRVLGQDLPGHRLDPHESQRRLARAHDHSGAPGRTGGRRHARLLPFAQEVVPLLNQYIPNEPSSLTIL